MLDPGIVALARLTRLEIERKMSFGGRKGFFNPRIFHSPNFGRVCTCECERGFVLAFFSPSLVSSPSVEGECMST